VSSPGGFTGSLATSGSGTINIAGLSPGTSYSFVVYATNGIGNSGYSGSSNTITTTAVVPNAPTIGTATATGTTTASVTYTASSYNGGSTITSYTAVSSPGGITGSIATSGSGTINISGLSVGTSYSFTVYATNGIGNSPSSGSSNTITTNRLAVSVVISSATVNYVASTYQVPGYIAGVTDVTFTVNNDVGSASTGSYAFYVDTSWNGGDTVTIVNNSYIEGAGGAGGRSSAAGSYPANLPLPGGAGGPAVYVGRPVTFYNYGYVGGGGGGGGGGESGATGVLGGGGGGGQGYYGGAAGAAFVYPPYTGSDGTAGTYTSAGSGGAGGYFAGDYGYTGGNGGGLGSAGATGGGGGGAGGAGGACLVGLGYVNGGSGIGGAAYGSQS